MDRRVKVLIACESSGIVRDAFIARGHDVMSCDLKPTERHGPHYEGDVRDIIGEPWDLMIAHPVCKFLTNAGVRWLYEGGRKVNGIDPDRWQAMKEACSFYKMLCDADHIEKKAIENPIMHEYAFEIIGHRADQFVHPWWFGSPFQKATGLKLYNLPKLPQERTKKSYAPGEIKQEVWLMGPSPDREEKRSRTDPQVARAMAQYWGGA
jgi:hypothetical protein